MLSLSDGNCSFIGPGLYGDREVEGENKRMRGNAFELNPTFGLDCVEQRREVSSLRSRDLERFELGEQKRGFPFSSPASRSFFAIKKAWLKEGSSLRLNPISYSLIANGFG